MHLYLCRYVDLGRSLLGEVSFEERSQKKRELEEVKAKAKEMEKAKKEVKKQKAKKKEEKKRRKEENAIRAGQYQAIRTYIYIYICILGKLATFSCQAVLVS